HGWSTHNRSQSQPHARKDSRGGARRIFGAWLRRRARRRDRAARPREQADAVLLLRRQAGPLPRNSAPQNGRTRRMDRIHSRRLRGHACTYLRDQQLGSPFRAFNGMGGDRQRRQTMYRRGRAPRAVRKSCRAPARPAAQGIDSAGRRSDSAFHFDVVVGVVSARDAANHPPHPRHGTYRSALHAAAREFSPLARRASRQTDGSRANSVPTRPQFIGESESRRSTRPTRMKTRTIVIVAVLLLGAGAWAGYSILFNVTAPTDSLLVSGNIEAHESVVSFKAVQSRVVALPFDEGQWVTAGTLLAQLDDSDYRQQVAINEAALHVQEQELSSAMQKLEAARATVANDNADLAQKNIDYGRSQKLWIDKIISGDQRAHTETALKQSSAGMQRDVAMERSAQQDIEVAKANIRNASANLELARIMLGYTTLRAPFSGVILTRQTELGEVMQPGTPVVTLADLDHVWLRAYVAETDLGRIRWGQAATVHTDTYPDRAYPGQISFIASEAEFTPKSVETHKERVTLVYRIKIDVENPRHELKPGMPADATIQLGAPVQSGNSRG